MPTDLKTDSGLLERLALAATRQISRDELHEQRVSFIYGNLPEGSTITREHIEEVLAKIEGEAVPA
jgi:hypothetical protein